MVTWNAVTSAVFDVLLAPFGHDPAWFDLLVWSLLAGVLALWVYKKVSNQAAIAAAKDRIQANVLEIRLFRHDPLQVLVSAGKALARNAVYLGHNLVPMAVLTLPMLAVLSQLVANYALDPVPEGSVQMLELKLDPRSGVSPRDVKLVLPPGVALDAPPVRTASSRSSAPRAVRRCSTRASRRCRADRRWRAFRWRIRRATWGRCRAASSACWPASCSARSPSASR